MRVLIGVSNRSYGKNSSKHNVDPQLIEYRAKVLDLLRPAYNSLAHRCGALQHSAGPYANAIQLRHRKHERTRVRTEERVSSGSKARTIVQGIEAATADIRRAMTQKYQAEF